jgi:enoyl-CoA hydratase/carnithine racemase
MSTTFSRLGLIAEYGCAWLLTRLVGLAGATDLLLTGRTITGEQALAMGLVNAVDEDPVGVATAWALELAERCSPSALAVMKAQLLQVDGQRMDEAVVTSLAEMRRAFERPDLAEAIAARTEQRPAVFPPLA